MKSTQNFIWVSDTAVVAFLEVRHEEWKMVLNIDVSIAGDVRGKMNDLNGNGTYPNREISHPDDPFTQFIISISSNWSARWCDFRTMLDRLLGIHSVEYDPSRLSRSGYTLIKWAADSTPNSSEGLAITCPNCGMVYRSEEEEEEEEEGYIYMSTDSIPCVPGGYIQHHDRPLGFITCPVHGERYWYEDMCSQCAEEKED